MSKVSAILNVVVMVVSIVCFVATTVKIRERNEYDSAILKSLNVLHETLLKNNDEQMLIINDHKALTLSKESLHVSPAQRKVKTKIAFTYYAFPPMPNIDSNTRATSPSARHYQKVELAPSIDIKIDSIVKRSATQAIYDSLLIAEEPLNETDYLYPGWDGAVFGCCVVHPPGEVCSYTIGADSRGRARIRRDYLFRLKLKSDSIKAENQKQGK